MGYEQNIPPVPTRHQQIQALDKLEESWLNQRYWKYYMNETLRIPKMQFAKKLNQTYSHVLINWIIWGAVFLPFAYLSRRFLIRRGGFPTTKIPDAFDRQRTDLQVRKLLELKYILPSWLGLSTIFAYATTDFSQVIDQEYNYVHKPPVMM